MQRHRKYLMVCKDDLLPVCKMRNVGKFYRFVCAFKDQNETKKARFFSATHNRDKKLIYFISSSASAPLFGGK